MAIIGYGKFGRCHATKYSAMAGVEIKAIIEPRPERRHIAQCDFPRAKVLATLDELVVNHRPDMASITTPATLHYPIAKQCLQAGIHILVEKPLTVEPSEANELVRLAGDKNLVLQPGHLERFNRTLDELRARLSEPYWLEARRVTRWCGRGDDVDVVMDLMVHDLDLTLELLPMPITQLEAYGAKVFTSHWDIVNTQLTFANGEVANLLAARAGLRQERSLKVSDRDGRTVARVDNGSLKIEYRGESDAKSDICHCQCKDPLAIEIKQFVNAVKYHRRPPVDSTAGYRVVDIAKRISDAVRYDEKLHSLATNSAQETTNRQLLSQSVV